ncbi:hypothetical protein Q7P35_011662 [Cladosporium inversicolor]
MKLATLLTFASLATTITSQDFTSANDEEISICETNTNDRELVNSSKARRLESVQGQLYHAEGWLTIDQL